MKAFSAFILPILVFYFSSALTIMLFEKIFIKKARYELELFWSYEAILGRKTQLIAENFWNSANRCTYLRAAFKSLCIVSSVSLYGRKHSS